MLRPVGSEADERVSRDTHMCNISVNREHMNQFAVPTQAFDGIAVRHMTIPWFTKCIEVDVKPCPVVSSWKMLRVRNSCKRRIVTRK